MTVNFSTVTFECNYNLIKGEVVMCGNCRGVE